MFAGHVEQQAHIAPDAEAYMKRHHVKSLPHVGVLDPRTQSTLWHRDGKFLDSEAIVQACKDPMWST